MDKVVNYSRYQHFILEFHGARSFEVEENFRGYTLDNIKPYYYLCYVSSRIRLHV